MILVSGIVSRSANHFHFFYDYDSIEPEGVLEAAKSLASRFTADILIRSTYLHPSGLWGNFHLICLNPMSPQEVFSMENWTPANPDVDDYIPLKTVLAVEPHLGTGCTLRISPKGTRPAPRNYGLVASYMRTVCYDYLEFFNVPYNIPPTIVTIPKRLVVADCSPTFCLYKIIRNHRFLE